MPAKLGPRPLIAATLALVMSACGGDEASTTLCQDNGVSVTIVDNHPTGSHVLVIPVDDVVAGIAVTYDIQGLNTGHGHTVTVSPPDFSALQDGTEITLTSSNNGSAGMSHTHDIILTCQP